MAGSSSTLPSGRQPGSRADPSRGCGPLAYLATTRTGHSYVVAVLAENPSQPINQATAAPAMLSAVKGAFTLATRN